MEENTISLKKRLLKSTFWLVGGRFFIRTIGLINMAILARLLMPEDFGKIAVIISIQAMIEMFFSFGTNNYIIQKKDADDNDYNTVWTISIIRGIVVSLILFPICYLYTGQSGQESYLDIGFVIVFVIIIKSFRNTGFMIFAKNVDFSKDFLLSSVSRVVAFIGTIAAAFYWRDYRAILVGIVLTELSSFSFTYILCHYRPKLSLTRWHDIFQFSIWLTIGSAIFAVISKIDTLILSRYLGDKSAGLFTISRDIAALPTNELVGPINTVMFSGLSEIKNDKRAFLALYLKVQSLILLIAMPVGFGLVIVAPDFIPVFLGSGWNDTIYLVQLITAMMTIQMININFTPVILSLGKTKLIMLRSLIYALVRPTFFIIGILNGGLVGAVYGYCAAGLFLALIEYVILSSVLKLKIVHFIQRIWRILFALVIMIMACLFIKDTLSSYNDSVNHMINIIALICTGGASYTVTILTLWYMSGKPQGAEDQLISLIKQRF